jgi:hypothetical protein
MYKLCIFPLCFIMIACNAKEETKIVDNDYSLNNLLFEI